MTKAFWLAAIVLLVQGTAVGQTLTFKVSGTIVRELVGVKDIAIVYDPLTKGTTERRIPEAEGTAPAIGRPDLERLREMGLRLESSLGAPQDVEWSIQRGELRILQSRPITTM